MYSLRRRLLIIAFLLLVLFLGITAIGLNNVFKKSVLNNAQDSLQNQILLLIENIDVIDGKIIPPQALAEARLGQTDSSLFAQIIDQNSEVVWRSPSLLDQVLPSVQASLGDFQFVENPDWQTPMYSSTLSLEWETEVGDIPFTVQVSEYSAAYTKRLTRYQRTFGVWLTVLGAALLVLLLILFGWALKPLKKVSHQVGEIEQGQRQRFDEDYPLEVSRLTKNLNQLLGFDEQRINQQREVLGNLAHSLKTPIAVMKGLNYNDVNKEEANTQLDVMQNIIDYQLQSASTIGRRRFSKPIDIKTPTQQIINSLKKIYKEKAFKVTSSFDPDVVFYGDQGDWMEVAGNLLDNAFKWANTSISLEVISVEPIEQGSQRRGITLIVEDDGDGIDDNKKQSILQRGVRLDSQTPGHGLGMHIVKGIVQAYDGELGITNAGSQGTRFTVTLH